MKTVGGDDTLWGIGTLVNANAGFASSYPASAIVGIDAQSERFSPANSRALALALAREGGVDKETLLTRYMVGGVLEATIQLVLTFPGGFQPGEDDAVSVYFFDEEERLNFSPRSIRLPYEVNVCTLEAEADQTVLTCPGDNNRLVVRGSGSDFSGGWLRIMNTTVGEELDGLDAAPATRFPVLGLVFSSFSGLSGDFDQAYPIHWAAAVGAGGTGQAPFFAPTPDFVPWTLPNGDIVMPGDNATGGLLMTGEPVPVPQP
jgi:hypothetical protein